MKGKILHWNGVLLDYCFSGGGDQIDYFAWEKDPVWDKNGETAV